MLLSVDLSDSQDRTSPSFEIIAAIADFEGIDAVDLAPPEYQALYDVVNPEALDALFAPRDDGTPRGRGSVEFSFCGYDVVVRHDGTVQIDDPADSN